MVKTTVYLDPELALKIRRLSESSGRSQAELIREALAAFEPDAARRMPAGMGKFSSGHRDTSERAEEILERAARKGRWR